MYNKSYYKVGQAVLYVQSDKTEVLAIIKSETENQFGGKETTLTDIIGSELNFTYCLSKRPATEAEILTEIQKHGFGFANKKDVFSPKKYHHIKKAISGKWYTHSKPEIDNTNLKDFCEEGLITHRIITALNLV